MTLITEACREQNRQLHAARDDYGTSGKAWAPQVRPLADWGRKTVMCARRYQCQGPMPWYGNVEMFRQAASGEWGAVLAAVRDRLAAMGAASMQEAA